MAATPRWRTCCVCRARRSSELLVRLVSPAPGEVALGAGRPGRGAWICATAACVERLGRASLERALRTSIEPTSLESLRSSLRAWAR